LQVRFLPGPPLLRIPLISGGLLGSNREIMKRKLDQFLTAFISATESTLNELCKIEITQHRLLTPTSLPTGKSSVAGVIGITSPSLQGSMSVQFPKGVFLLLMNRMLGENMEELTPGLEDGAAEITNIIFGNAKVKLNEMGFDIQMALPNLLTGKKLESLGTHRPESFLGVEFFIGTDSFWIIFELNSKNQELLPPRSEIMKSKNWSAEALLEFVKAVRKTMEVQFNTKIEIGQPFKKSETQSFTFDVGSVIGVTDQDFTGFFGMYYQSGTFLGLMNLMLGTTFEELNDEIQDGASEITNICFGVAKQVLNQQGHQIQMALPYLIRGSEISSSSRSQGRSTIAVPLNNEFGTFWVEFGYQENANRS